MKKEYICIAKGTNKARYLYVDKENAENILSFLQKDDKYKKKFQYVVQLLIEGNETSDIFGKEGISKDVQDVYAIKLFKGGDNSRIYCKTYELEDGSFHIIMAGLLEKKKSQKLTQKIKNLITKVSNYEYDIENVNPECFP